MEKVQVILVAIAFIACFYLTGKAIYHTFYVVTNITGKYGGLFGPLILFMPGQFNEIGNQHRVSLFPSLLGVAICWGVFFFTGVLEQ